MGGLVSTFQVLPSTLSASSSTLRALLPSLISLSLKAHDILSFTALWLGSTLAEVPYAVCALTQRAAASVRRAHSRAVHIYDNSPSIYLKTPVEHIDEAFEERVGVVQRKRIPPRHVRVKFYETYANFIAAHKADLEVDVMLEADGELDLSHIREMWGLEAYAILDPVRYGAFEPQRPDRLSRMAIKILTDLDGHLTIFEPTPSLLTLTKRFLRVNYLRENEKTFRRMEVTHRYLAACAQPTYTACAPHIERWQMRYASLKVSLYGWKVVLSSPLTRTEKASLCFVILYFAFIAVLLHFCCI